VTGMPSAEEAEIQTEADKVTEESKMHDPVRHPFKYPTDKMTSINKKISVSIKFPDEMRITMIGISATELKHQIERFGVALTKTAKKLPFFYTLDMCLSTIFEVSQFNY